MQNLTKQLSYLLRLSFLLMSRVMQFWSGVLQDQVNGPMLSLAPGLSLLCVVQDARLAVLLDPDSDLIQPTSPLLRCTAFLWEADLQNNLMGAIWPSR